MDRLHEYLAAHGIRQADFAMMVGATQATISKLIGGTVTPSLALALRIQRATNGSVACEHWLPLDGATEDAA